MIPGEGSEIVPREKILYFGRGRGETLNGCYLEREMKFKQE